MSAPNGTGTAFANVAELVAWLGRAPSGTMLPAPALAALLADLTDAQPAAQEAPAPPEPATWRERLWTVPAETRLGVRDVAEALGRPASYVYARTGPSVDDPIPHRKLDGSVVVTAGELRAWIRAHETVIAAGPMESTAAERRLGVVS